MNQLHNHMTDADLKKMEQYWTNFSQLKKDLKAREVELLHPHLFQDDTSGIRTSTISKPTENKAIILSQDIQYQNLQRVVKTVEELYEECDDEMKKIIQMRYWGRNLDTFEWETIADTLYLTRWMVLRKRKALMKETMKRIGWI